MQGPPDRTDTFLTGNVRVRVGRFGRLIPQVEVQFKTYEAFDFERRRCISDWQRWRDMSREDLAWLGGTFKLQGETDGRANSARAVPADRQG